MQGSTHRTIAPIFTAGFSTYFLQATQVHPFSMFGIAGTVAAVIIASASSYMSANWADADLHAMCKPVPIIWAGVDPRKDRARGVRKVVGNHRTSYIYKNVRYSGGVKRWDMRVWATFFRKIGVRKHRDFKSHSPALWVPVWFGVLCIAKIPITLDLSLLLNSEGILASLLSLIISLLFSVIYSILLGLAMGYWSHLVGDAFTKSGIPFLPDIKIVQKFPIIGPILEALSDIKIFRGKFFTAGNKVWNYIVILILIDVSLYLLLPDFAKVVNNALFSGTIGLIKASCSFIYYSIIGLLKKVGSLLGLQFLFS